MGSWRACGPNDWTWRKSEPLLRLLVSGSGPTSIQNTGRRVERKARFLYGPDRKRDDLLSRTPEQGFGAGARGASMGVVPGD